jgi:hypothetical protein
MAEDGRTIWAEAPDKYPQWMVGVAKIGFLNYLNPFGERVMSEKEELKPVSKGDKDGEDNIAKAGNVWYKLEVSKKLALKKGKKYMVEIMPYEMPPVPGPGTTSPTPVPTKDLYRVDLSRVNKGKKGFWLFLFILATIIVLGTIGYKTFQWYKNHKKGSEMPITMGTNSVGNGVEQLIQKNLEMSGKIEELEKKLEEQRKKSSTNSSTSSIYPTPPTNSTPTNLPTSVSLTHTTNQIVVTNISQERESRERIDSGGQVVVVNGGGNKFTFHNYNGRSNGDTYNTSPKVMWPDDSRPNRHCPIMGEKVDLPPGEDYCYCYPTTGKWRVDVYTDAESVKSAYNVGTEQEPKWVLTRDFNPTQTAVGLRLKNLSQTRISVSFTLTRKAGP